MFKFVVLSALLAVAACAPGYLGGYVLPAATSYQSRVDVHSKPIITYAAAPIITKTLVAEPLVSSYGYGGHGYGHASPVLSYGGLGGHGYGLGHGLEYGHYY